VVTDDSLSAGAADRIKASLQELAKRFNTRIRYAGRRERAQYADALAAESGVSPEIIRFAILGDERCGLSTGSNRNSLLLDTAGSLLLSVDDDTFCRIAVSPGSESTVSFSSLHDPTEFRFFPNRADALQSVSVAEADILACHEWLLGSDIDPAGSVEERGRVVITLNGLMGDSGMASPSYYLTLTGPSRDRLVASPQAYRSALVSREVIRTAPKPTITAGPFCMTTFLGLDNRILLPPFFPVERNSDGVFGHLVQHCVGGSHVAFLPWTLLHAPEPPRAFGPDALWADTSRVRVSDIVIAGVLAHEMAGDQVTTEARLVELGQHLQWMASLSLAEFEGRLGALQRFRNFGLITVLQNQLQTYGRSPDCWADDVMRMIELMSKASTARDYIVPRDLRSDGDIEQARRVSQELVGKFGELLEAWPTIVAASRQLALNGCRLTAAL
jgi:hypothetical protein